MSESTNRKRRVFKRQNYSDYKPTGNIAIDMVGACISHYRRLKRLPQHIALTPKYWELFTAYVKKNQPQHLTDEGVNFDDVMIIKGSVFQSEPLRVEHKSKIIKTRQA